jgi:hypothetical protein
VTVGSPHAGCAAAASQQKRLAVAQIPHNLHWSPSVTSEKREVLYPLRRGKQRKLRLRG